jgi:hypothetical protein
VDEWFRRAEEVWNDAHMTLQCSIHHQKEQADRNRSEALVFHPGDLFWLSTRNLLGTVTPSNYGFQKYFVTKYIRV